MIFSCLFGAGKYVGAIPSTHTSSFATGSIYIFAKSSQLTRKKNDDLEKGRETEGKRRQTPLVDAVQLQHLCCSLYVFPFLLGWLRRGYRREALIPSPSHQHCFCWSRRARNL